MGGGRRERPQLKERIQGVSKRFIFILYSSEFTSLFSSLIPSSWDSLGTDGEDEGFVLLANPKEPGGVLTVCCCGRLDPEGATPDPDLPLRNALLRLRWSITFFFAQKMQKMAIP